jgi:seryl-tRNA synthetase
VIDLKTLREDPEAVRASQRARGEDASLVDVLLDADESRRTAVSKADALRAEQKQVGKRVGKAEGAERDAALAEARELAARVKEAEAEQTSSDERLLAAQKKVSNVVEPQTPAGGEDDFAVLKHVGEPPEFDFDVRDHLELGTALGAFDTERGAKVSGARFYFLTGVGAQLELALMNLAAAQATEAGFTLVVPPVLVRPEIMDGTGFLGAHAGEIYRLEEDDLYLVGTSEVPLAGYRSGEILDLAHPLRYAGWSTCFRREAGSYGKDTRGIIRVHQFNKLEMFVYCREQDSRSEHERLLAWEEEMLAKIEVPYRVIDVAAGDLGASAARKFDCEAWVPSQRAYRELTSTSNCTSFQARRLNTRYREEGVSRFASTLNGTLATTRWIVAILENHQLPDGSVRVPEALRPFLGGREVLEPTG